MARTDLVLHRADIAEPARYYDGERAIVVRRGLLLTEERRFLWHEIVHADRRDRACYTNQKVEVSVDREAARRAIPSSALMWGWCNATDWVELAELLKLPEHWVRWRVQIAHPAERGLLHQERERRTA